MSPPLPSFTSTKGKERGNFRLSVTSSVPLVGASPSGVPGASTEGVNIALACFGRSAVLGMLIIWFCWFIDHITPTHHLVKHQETWNQVSLFNAAMDHLLLGLALCRTWLTRQLKLLNCHQAAVAEYPVTLHCRSRILSIPDAQFWRSASEKSGWRTHKAEIQFRGQKSKSLSSIRE